MITFLGADDPVAHVVNHRFGDSYYGWWLWSAQQGNLVLTGLVMLILFPILAGRIATGPASQGNARYVTRGTFGHMLEVICLYLRENTVRPLLGDRTDRFMPFLWTMFFFILINNLLGLLPIVDLLHLLDIKAFGGSLHLADRHTSPIGGTATQNLFVTAMLALIAFVVINLSGIAQLGVGGYLKHLTGGAPAFIWPILVPVEIMGTVIKPVALAIRLFANMTAGHILLATLFMFVGMSLRTGLAIGAPVTLLSALGGTAIMFLELFVAFLQAYVFMFLTAVFVSQLSHHDGHEHDHDAEHAQQVVHTDFPSGEMGVHAAH